MGPPRRPHRGGGDEHRDNAIAERLARLPANDQHCHAPLASWRSLGGKVPGWRRCFTEARGPRSINADVPASLGYREFLQAMTAFLGDGDDVPTVEADVVRRRDEAVRAEGEGYARRLLNDAGLTTLLVDTGYGGREALTPGLFAEMAGRPVRTIVRVESVAEAVLAARTTRSITRVAFTDALLDRLDQALMAGAVGFKSVAAYRAGLDLPDPSPRQVAGALRRSDIAQQARRLDDPVLVAHVLWTAARLAAVRGVPLQLHTGFGDEDLHLPAADPALLRPLLRDATTEACPIVLLHSYPFVAQAAYLASIYPTVHVDLSLAIPLLGGAAAERLVGEALALCPVTKLLAGSDGHSYPEMHWRGLRLWRYSLVRVLTSEVASGRMDDSEVEPIAGAILAGNSQRLYRLAQAA